MSMFGDNLKNLWKQLDKSRHEDLPKTELGIRAMITIGMIALGLGAGALLDRIFHSRSLKNHHI